MKISFITLSFLWMLLACKHKEVTKEMVSYGQAEALFNGRVWPDQTSDTFTQVSAQRFRGRCRQTDDRRTANVYTIGISTGKQSTKAYTESVSFAFEPGTLPLSRSVQSENSQQGINEICEVFAKQLGSADFDYMFNDGFDIMAYSNYVVNNNRINTLTITRLDTIAKVIEGRFDVSFVRLDPPSKTKPDTIHIRCSRFVAPLNM